MSKTLFIDFKAVKAAVTMEQVFKHYGFLERFKKSGDSLNGPCPIHRGENPTQFRVSMSKNIWHCFSKCNRGGNVLDFISRMEDVSIHAAALKAIEWFGLDPDAMSAKAEDEKGARDKTSKTESSPAQNSTETKSAPDAEANGPNKPLKFRLDKLEGEHPYLTSRGLTKETIVDFGIGYCQKGMMAERIAIPIHNPQGEVVAYAGRFPGRPDERTAKYKLPPGFRKSLEIFNIDRAIKESGQQVLVIVEGFFDCMKLHQLGCRKVVALMGSTMSAQQEELIRKHTDRQSRVIIMLDEDEAGKAGRDDIAVRLAKFVFVKVHTFDKDNMQPEDLTAGKLAAVLA